MASEFRARGAKQASPPATLPPPQYQPRYPPRDHHLDADERKALAQPGSLKQSQHAFGGLRLASSEWKLLAGIVVLAMCVRLYHLSWPASVVFDEVHFGKFAGKYIHGRYYVDVHPPLAKLLITFMAVLGGFNGDFEFKEIGLPYPSDVPYVLMRSLPALMGVGVVPLAYLTLRGLDCRPATALLGSLFITFENGLITQSRLILLDSPLIFFTALTVFCWVGFSNENHQEPFTEDWWLWLALTGLSLGAVASCKWVGLFTIATIGLATMKQLWDLLGDLKVPPRVWMRHFLARALCLIVLPITVYMAVFEIHFMVLQNSGDGDGFMSAQFQQSLKGKGMQDTWADIALGSEITLRHVNTQGGYLHSHEHNYPTGSNQQQITLYPHKDGNNVWRILEGHSEGQRDYDYATEPIKHVRNHMSIRFEHIPTQRRLHSHDVRPPVSDVDFQNEVSAYGFPGFVGDANDNWIVEIEHGDSHDKHSSGRLRTLGTVFRLRHALQGCYLFSHKVKLPEWGFEQQEVTCNKNAVKANSLWYIETNEHPQLGQNDEKVNYRRPSFLTRFLELNHVMWTTNAGLTDRHAFDSRPESWLSLKRGINFWVRDHRHVYLIGNPVIWWLSTAAVVTYLVARGILVLRAKRQYKDLNNSFVVKYDQICGFLTIGWFIHYFPFFIMSRQLFLHHYFPALYFAILLTASIFDLATSSLKPKIRLQVAGVLIVAAVWTWWHFSPLTYAGEWTRGKCDAAKWRKTWDFSCDSYPSAYSEYANFPSMSQAVVQATGAVPHPDGHVPHEEGDIEHIAGESAQDASQTESAIQQVEPGRDIFAEHANKQQQPKSSSEAGGQGAAGPVQEMISSQADPNEQTAQAVQPPPPLPKNEPKELSTEEVVPAPEQPKVEPDSKPKGDATTSGAESEEEKIRKELFPDDTK
ncbi:hypothetical protein FRC00_005275 [Tulasnella sp. 408]|nr:hypothetical protein FRC00_005275 [Tulasnella sp. 408]